MRQGLWASQQMRNPRLRFGEVQGHAERALIVATGPSARDADLERIGRMAEAGRVHVIAVNRALRTLPRVNSWFTLDPDENVRPLMQQPRPGTAYYAAVPIDYGLPFACKTEHRFGIPAGITYLQRVLGPPPKYWQGGLSTSRQRIHTGNSAWGALQVAFLMGARRIGLIGIDATPDPYAFEEGKPRDLGLLPWIMRTAVPQLHQGGVRVVNGSPMSRVCCFEKATPDHCLDWVEG